jgi:hypothetical protein
VSKGRKKKILQQNQCLVDEFVPSFSDREPYIRNLYRHSDCVYFPGISESEPAAFDLVKRLRIEHWGPITDEELANFRRVIRKILLQNSRNVVMAILGRNIGPTCRTIKVRCLFCISPSLVVDGASIQANCEYIMNYQTDTDGPESSSLPKFGRAVQDLWAEQIIPILLEYPSCLTVDDNAV